MAVNGAETTSAATGNGPVDAAIRALQDSVSDVAISALRIIMWMPSLVVRMHW